MRLRTTKNYRNKFHKRPRNISSTFLNLITRSRIVVITPTRPTLRKMKMAHRRPTLKSHQTIIPEPSTSLIIIRRIRISTSRQKRPTKQKEMLRLSRERRLPSRNKSSPSRSQKSQKTMDGLLYLPRPRITEGNEPLQINLSYDYTEDDYLN
jgi:hypothetical protein